MIKIFNKEIPFYGVCFFVGILISAIIAFVLLHKRKWDKFDFLCCIAYLLIGAILGAKLLFIAVSIDTIIEYNLSFIEIMKGGFVFYGGLLGGALGVFVYGKQFKLSSIKYMDLCATVLPLGHAMGRVGCFLSGCCYGIEYDGFLSHVYHSSSNVLTPLGVGLFPVQLLEASLLLLLFVSLIIMWFKNVKTGKITVTYLISYAIMRFSLEYLRGDSERGILLGLSTSQWISVLIVIAICIYYLIKYLKNKKANN
ncbi:MAG: prolipoprotein diacylglyceryl transferase [Clostridiales bacterium]|nr:prolipoprotein diacylglyceryl transferase [Clostridiales bacterium]